MPGLTVFRYKVWQKLIEICHQVMRLMAYSKMCLCGKQTKTRRQHRVEVHIHSFC